MQVFSDQLNCYTNHNPMIDRYDKFWNLEIIYTKKQTIEMKHLKKFENFHLDDPMGSDVDTDEQSYLDYKMSSVDSESEFTEEEGDWDYQEEMPIRRTIGDEIDEKKSTPYKRSRGSKIKRGRK